LASGREKIYRNWLGNVHIIRNTFGARGVQRFVTKPCKIIGICRVFCYEGEGSLKIRKIVLRIIWTFPNQFHEDIHRYSVGQPKRSQVEDNI
jgi:hypothetical protein